MITRKTVSRCHEELVLYRDALRERREQLKQQSKERVLALHEGRVLDARNLSKLTADSLKECVVLENKLRKVADSLAGALRSKNSR